MPHNRKRFAISVIQKKLKYSPVVAIQGARQTGKSFLCRELLQPILPKSKYLSFDQDSVRSQANDNVENFLIRYNEAMPLILDEAQKVPKIFDAVKFEVDQKRIPGRYLLLGSTEFSKLNLIRESLTGRISKIRLYPLTLAEANELPHRESSLPFFLDPKPSISRKQLLNHLEKGGLPAAFSIRSEDEHEAAMNDWIDLTVQRDIHTFPKTKLDSVLAKKILTQIATLPEPTAGHIAKELRVDLRRIKTHLVALETLFAIQPVEPLSLGTGKTIYYLFDVGIATRLGASNLRQLETLFLQQYLAKNTFLGATLKSSTRDRFLSYYRSSHGGRVSFVEETKDAIHAVQILGESKINQKSFYQLLALGKVLKKERKTKDVSLLVLSPHDHVLAPKGVKLYVWESMG